MEKRSTLVVGTRGSPLAVAQARETAGRLAAALGWPLARVPLRTFTTTGDAIQDRPLSQAGGKGLFTKELDVALRDGAIDLAVHSAKDLPTAIPSDLVIAGYLPREDVRDALISRRAGSVDELPAGAVVGSASLRRQAQLKRLRPDLAVTLLRGNVGTRIAKLESGEVDATLLALAGLRRLGLASHATAVLDTDAFLPAVGQGAIAVMARARDEHVLQAIAAIADAATGTALAAERAFLGVLDGSCRTPIAGYARVEAGRLLLRGQVLRPDGSDARETALDGAPETAAQIGREAGLDIKGRLPPGFLTDL